MQMHRAWRCPDRMVPEAQSRVFCISVVSILFQGKLSSQGVWQQCNVNMCMCKIAMHIASGGKQPPGIQTPRNAWCAPTCTTMAFSLLEYMSCPVNDNAPLLRLWCTGGEVTAKSCTTWDTTTLNIPHETPLPCI